MRDDIIRVLDEVFDGCGFDDTELAADTILKLFENINRLEVIDETGRVYTNYNVKELELSLQDEGLTLKLFIK